MGQKSVQVVLYPRPNKDRTYPIKIRITENRKSKYYNLGFKIEKKFWLKSNRVSVSHPEHEIINETIELKLEEFRNNIIISKTTGLIPDLLKKIEELEFNGSYSNMKRHKTIYYHLIRFKDDSIKYSDIDNDFVKKFKRYLELNIEPRKKHLKVSDNTINNYLKVLKSLLKDKVDLKIFHNIIPQKKTTPKDVLSTLDIFKIEHFFINDKQMTQKRFDCVNTFMFQFFSQGMRISDVLLLKYGNIEGNKIRINMKKTNKEVLIPLVWNNCFRILWYIEPYSKLYDFKKKEFNFYISPKTDIEKNHNQEFFKNISSHKNFDKELIDDLIKYYEKIDLFKEITEWYQPEFYNVDEDHIKFNKYSKEFFNFMKSQFEDFDKGLIETRNKLYVRVYEFIKNFCQVDENKNTYVFPFLRKLKSRDEKVIFNKISSSTTFINKKLKEVQRILDISKNITTHLSRHSIISISKDMGVDIYDLKSWLGHTSVKITETYVNSLSNSSYVETIKNINKLLDE